MPWQCFETLLGARSGCSTRAIKNFRQPSIAVARPSGTPSYELVRPNGYPNPPLSCLTKSKSRHFQVIHPMVSELDHPCNQIKLIGPSISGAALHNVIMRFRFHHHSLRPNIDSDPTVCACAKFDPFLPNCTQCPFISIGLFRSSQIRTTEVGLITDSGRCPPRRRSGMPTGKSNPSVSTEFSLLGVTFAPNLFYRVTSALEW